MQTPSFRLGGEHADDQSSSNARDWDEFLGIDGLVQSLDYGFQDAAVAPLVHDHYSPSWNGYAKPGHVLMPGMGFHQSRTSLAQYAIGVEQHQDLHRYQQQQQRHQVHRRSVAQPVSNVKQARHPRSHKRKAEVMAFSTSPGHGQHLLEFADGSSSGAGVQAVSYQCVKQAPAVAPAPEPATHVGRWTKKEHELFLDGLKLYGRSWKKISTLVVTRTLVQIRTHAQKYLQKQSRAAQKLAAAASSGANDLSASPATSCASTPSSTFTSDPHDSRSCTGSSLEHAMIHRELLLLPSPTPQASSVACPGWRLSPPRGQALLPVEFPTSMSSSAAPRAPLAPCASSSSPSSLAPLSSASPGINFVSSFKLDQLLQDEPEYFASPSNSSVRSEPKLAQRILAPITSEGSEMLEKPAQRRSNGLPHVLTGHELLHTFDHLYAGSLLASPSLPSPVIANAPRMDAYGGYCDWM